VLKTCAARIAQAEPIDTVLTAGREELARTGFVVDYLEARNAETLQPVANLADGPIRLLVAARLGRTRLIDNLAVR
jgi:pantoate--beta-alanine ligase